MNPIIHLYKMLTKKLNEPPPPARVCRGCGRSDQLHGIRIGPNV